MIHYDTIFTFPHLTLSWGKVCWRCVLYLSSNTRVRHRVPWPQWTQCGHRPVKGGPDTGHSHHTVYIPYCQISVMMLQLLGPQLGANIACVYCNSIVIKDKHRLDAFKLWCERCKSYKYKLSYCMLLKLSHLVIIGKILLNHQYKMWQHDCEREGGVHTLVCYTVLHYLRRKPNCSNWGDIHKIQPGAAASVQGGAADLNIHVLWSCEYVGFTFIWSSPPAWIKLDEFSFQNSQVYNEWLHWCQSCQHKMKDEMCLFASQCHHYKVMLDLPITNPTPTNN